MIVIDTSALIAVIEEEPSAAICRLIIENEKNIVISAATMVEAFIVAARRGFSYDMNYIISSAITRIVDVTPERAKLAVDAYTRWGKGFHPAALNFGDCFSYAAAKEFDCPLLYIGNDFARTDIASAAPSA